MANVFQSLHIRLRPNGIFELLDGLGYDILFCKKIVCYRGHRQSFRHLELGIGMR